MSKYTTELRYICEVAAGLSESVDGASIDTILTAAAPSIFNFDWDIFDEAYRLPLEVKILRHFYTREIGEETVGLWKLRLQDKLTLIMPKYNQLYESARMEFNPFYDTEYTRTGSNSGSGQVNTQSNSDTTNMHSDTPQNGLTSVLDGEYLTDADVSSGTSNSGQSSQNQGAFEETVAGKMRGESYSRLLIEYRQSFINIDAMLMNELNDLFMGLW